LASQQQWIKIYKTKKFSSMAWTSYVAFKATKAPNLPKQSNWWINRYERATLKEIDASPRLPPKVYSSSN